MTDLRCSVETCFYNSNNGCCKGNIKVEGKDSVTVKDTCCSSFKERTKNCCSNEGERPNKAIDVSCDAVKCIYNCDLKCSASGIGIAGMHARDVEQTECSSFRVKA